MWLALLSLGLAAIIADIVICFLCEHLVNGFKVIVGSLMSARRRTVPQLDESEASCDESSEEEDSEDDEEEEASLSPSNHSEESEPELDPVEEESPQSTIEKSKIGLHPPYEKCEFNEEASGGADKSFAEKSSSNSNESVDIHEAMPSKKRHILGKKKKSFSSDGDKNSNLDHLRTGGKSKMGKILQSVAKKIRFEGSEVDDFDVKLIKNISRYVKNETERTADAIDEEPRVFKIGMMRKEAQNKAPSLWDYDPLSLPDELLNVVPESYLLDSSVANICHLPMNILIRICSMLLPLEFIELSLACRFLHWRMFTYCTCYVPYTARMEIIEYKLLDGMKKHNVVPEAIYFKRELSGIFVLQPKCLKAPFFFETLEVIVRLRANWLFLAADCVLPVRQFARRMKVIHYRESDLRFNPHAPAVFFEKMEVNSFRFWLNRQQHLLYGTNWKATSEMWGLVEQARQMEEVCLFFPLKQKYKHFPLTNRFGIYKSPGFAQMKGAITHFHNGTSDLEFHAYIGLCFDHPLIYKHSGDGDHVEYYSERYGHIWKEREKETSPPKQYELRVYKKNKEAVLLVGKKESFFENQRRYRRLRRIAERDPTEDDSSEEKEHPDDYDEDLAGNCWKMETALSKPKKKNNKKKTKAKKEVDCDA